MSSTIRDSGLLHFSWLLVVSNKNIKNEKEHSHNNKLDSARVFTENLRIIHKRM